MTVPGIPPIVPYPLPTEPELPENVAQWNVRPRRAVLLLHDMQRFFVRPLPTDDGPGDGLLANTAALRQACADAGMRIAYTAQPGMSPAERGLLAEFWGPGMNTTEQDRGIVDGLEPEEQDWLLTKWRYSAFFATPLLERMRAEGRDQLVVCGVYAHVGVLATAVEAFTNDIQTFLVADAVADFDEGSHRMALEYAASRCAVVTTTERLLAEISGEQPRRVATVPAVAS